MLFVALLNQPAQLLAEMIVIKNDLMSGFTLQKWKVLMSHLRIPQKF